MDQTLVIILACSSPSLLFSRILLTNAGICNKSRLQRQVRPYTTPNIGTRMTTTKSLNVGAKIATTNPLVSLPDAIFSNILEYLDWGDMGRLDTAFFNRDTRNSYLFALQLMKVKVERNEFWKKAVDRGILSWLIRRNIGVISWDLIIDNDVKLISIASGLPQLQSLNISDSYCDNITDEGIRALANGLSQLQSLNISGCVNITGAGREIAARINSRR